jgi:hypothetical protein
MAFLTPVTQSGSPKEASCAWTNSPIGCVCNLTPPIDVCCEVRCNALFHHACGVQWEEWAYRKESPTGLPDQNPYDSDGKKYCPAHHPHQVKVMDSFKKASAATSEGTQHSSANQKISAKEKKEKEIDWAKKRKLEEFI